MHIKPKKNLGQNFLFDKNVQRKIIAACEFAPSDTVLEIGAGNGEMTALILEKVKKLYTLEIDSRLIEKLTQDFKDRPNVKIIKQDILKFNLGRYFSKEKKIKVFGNIPYYITTPIIERLISCRKIIDTIFITVQKEFAQRVLAHKGAKSYGSLSCFLQYYTDPCLLFIIKRGSFFPSPKVDSALLKLKVKPETALALKKEEALFRIIRAAFNQRRKILKNSLKGIVSANRLGAFFEHYRLSPNARAENLSLADFIELTNLQ